MKWDSTLTILPFCQEPNNPTPSLNDWKRRSTGSTIIFKMENQNQCRQDASHHFQIQPSKTKKSNNTANGNFLSLFLSKSFISLTFVFLSFLPFHCKKNIQEIFVAVFVSIVFCKCE